MGAMADEASLLTALLEDQYGPLCTVALNITEAEKQFLVTTCCVRIIAHTALRISNGNLECAQLGLDALFDGLRGDLIEVHEQKTDPHVAEAIRRGMSENEIARLRAFLERILDLAEDSSVWTVTKAALDGDRDIPDIRRIT